MKTSKIIITIISIIIIWIFMYACFGFTKNDLNSDNWEESTRILYAVINTLLSIIPIPFIWDNRLKNKE